MFKNLRILSALIIILVSLMSVTGCNSASKQTEAKLEEMQKQLDATRKELEASKEKAIETARAESQAASEAANQANNAIREAASKTAGAAKPATRQTAAAVDGAANSAKTAMGKAIDENKTAIASNRTAIQESQARAERAQGTAEEAKRMATPAPYHTLAAGTPLAVRTATLITTKQAATGSIFEASLAEPLVVDGFVVAQKGAAVEGVVTSADPGGRVKGVATIAVALRSLMMEDGRRLPIRTTTVSEEAKKSGKKDALKVGIASGIGAAIGAIAGGGKGAAIGAGAGAAGGTGVTMATRGEAAEIPAESVLNFTLSAPVKFQELKK